MKTFGKIIVFTAVMGLTSAAFAIDKTGTGKNWDDQHFSQADTNGDGLVSRDEFTQEKLKSFSRYDANHDGKLSKEEHQQMAMEMRNQSQGSASLGSNSTMSSNTGSGSSFGSNSGSTSGSNSMGSTGSSTGSSRDQTSRSSDKS
jgi:hypothetical protein